MKRAPAPPTDVWVIGYGSLMSGLGLQPLGRLPVREVTRVALHNARRGFGKFSQHGDRFALVLEAVDPTEPIVAERLGSATPPGRGVEALALCVPWNAFLRVGEREGYAPWALQRARAAAQQDGCDLGSFLWHLYEREHMQLAGFRRQLFASTEYASPHYVPHPVPLSGETAITFLAPGPEGSGSDRVVPVRVRTGHLALLTFGEAWRAKPNASQLSYALACVLGGMHGVVVADLIECLADHPELRGRLVTALQADGAEERARFLDVTRLTAAAYARTLGTPEAARQRGGLERLLSACQ
jgi:hypothetical protein